MSIEKSSVEIGKAPVSTCVFTASNVSHQGHKSTLHFFFCQNCLFISFVKFRIVKFVFILFCAQSTIEAEVVLFVGQIFNSSVIQSFQKSKQKVVYYLLTKMSV